ncbi:MAG TPA: ATP-binding cassette domain-containing protein [Dehalococcoidia bacterium]|nr:ATP-binding cassette domain-containing protein [Dehalococcoidia bacterium]
MELEAIGVSRELKSGKALLNDISFSIEPGELVAIVGGSGAGKTTLLNALAGVAPPTSGHVRYDGRDYYENIDEFRHALGYVPQDDIIHRDLPLETTLRYSAHLRLPADSSPTEKEMAVQEALNVLGLAERSALPVKALSGGQRKRASIGVELLTRPRIFFLDEPTSGLDPAMSAELMRLLRRLADDGCTIVLTTHVTQDIGVCDKVIVLARDGHLAFHGPPQRALEYFDAAAFDEIYVRVAEDEPSTWSGRFRSSTDFRGPGPGSAPAWAVADERGQKAVGSFRQWLLLTRRNFDMLWRSPLTLAILLGSPLMVILMFAMLFKGGAFDNENPSPSATIMILFWVAFGAFFFGLTYGLLQICTEFPIFFRERLVNVRILPYVASKVAVLGPVLIFICILMLGVLKVSDRLPALGFEIYAEMSVTLILSAFAALALGLLMSALVSNPEQATIALPMLCFPQVLFSGAILPVPIMAFLGKTMSALMSDRWSFESLGHSVGLNALFANGASPLGPPLLAQYGDSFSRPVIETWLIMIVFTVVFLASTCIVLKRKSSAQAS